MAEVVLYVYDMTKSGNGHDAHNFSIVQMNKLLKEGINFGGIFHTAVQIYGNDEWAYGYRSKGTGVFNCPAGKNPSYTLREKIILGRTECSPSKVNKMLKELSDSWPGNKYNIVSRNSKHFSNELLERLGVPKLPSWVNRVTNIADAAKGAAGTLIKAKDEALKRVLNPIDFAFGSGSKKSTSAKSVKATPSEFNINISFFTENFKVSAPDIHNEEDNIGPVVQAIEEGPNDVIPIVEEPADDDDDDDDEPVIHKDEGSSSTVIDKPVPMHA
ncbi:deubiquitinase DESI2-like [Capsicum chacoense]